MKKKRWYAILIFAGIVIIVSGILILSQAIAENNKSQIWIRSVLLVFWIFFTISNYLLYKKETRKDKNV
jgi:divalent metal cation (Fe/Co/Zn/Cd) transporter